MPRLPDQFRSLETAVAEALFFSTLSRMPRVCVHTVELAAMTRDVVLDEVADEENR
jgi:hypothetical protein